MSRPFTLIQPESLNERLAKLAWLAFAALAGSREPSLVVARWRAGPSISRRVDRAAFHTCYTCALAVRPNQEKGARTAAQRHQQERHKDASPTNNSPGPTRHQRHLSQQC